MTSLGLLLAAPVLSAWVLTGAVPAPDVDALLATPPFRHRHLITEKEAALARERGVDEGVLLRWLEAKADACWTNEAACHELNGDGPYGSALKVLGHLGSAGSLPLLTKLEARRPFGARAALERILERAAAARNAVAACNPPTEEEVSAQKAELRDFLAIRWRAGQWRAERPSEVELTDLAYFYAAISRSPPYAPGKPPGTQNTSWLQPRLPPNIERDALFEQFEVARRAGDLEAVVRVGEAYLATLGYPGDFRANGESRFTWGGARYSNVMRDLAPVHEGLGNFEQAARLYRTANPGGGACGTSTSYRWVEQTKGTIRVDEALEPCRAVAERLLAVGSSAEDPRYGPAPLASNGFDLLRLYRGALVTLHRDLEPHTLVQVFSEAPPGERELAVARFERRGAEAWAARVHALEGAADLDGRGTLPLLLDRIAHGPPDERGAALDIVARIAERPEPDPCYPDVRTWGVLRGLGSQWKRPIRSLGLRCETRLTVEEREALARALLPHADDPEVRFREQLAKTLGAVGAPLARPTLRQLQRDRVVTGEYWTEVGAKRSKVRPLRSVSRAATEALERIREAERSDAFVRRHAPKKEGTKAR
jgi:hypothetical protein